MSFFEECDKVGHQLPTTLDIGKILFLLQTRIRREEDALYKEFDKLRASARATVTEQTTDSRASTKGFVTFNSSRSSHLAPHL
jgi:hypothetical protein